MQDAHAAAVGQALQPLGADAFAWVPRHNKAAAFPTDFGLVKAAPGWEDRVLATLRSQSWVRAVDPDRRLGRALAWEAEEGAGREAEGGACDLTEPACVHKPPGRMQTRPTMGLSGAGDDDPSAADGHSAPWRHSNASRRELLYPFHPQQNSVTSLFQADKLWSHGFKGQKVKMGVFDTGIRKDHPHVKNIDERSNWTHEPTLADGLGHGSFVAGVIASSDPQCPGFAPEVELHTFRVFTNDQVSYTSWFLDAFNYAIATEMDVVNLSIGGPDYLDEPFVDKVLEITSNGLIMVSAIGNDGPNYGTLNNPADQNDVIGVGGIDFSDRIAPFSSRGMSTWELPGGYGRVKPDIVAYGKDVSGSKIQTGCRSLSGTSVASPVVAGAVCLLASVVPQEKRPRLLNPASMKQALVGGAVPIPGAHIFEQGQGKMNLINSMEILRKYEPHASVVPKELDLTNCPYMWPLCKQPLYANAQPVMFNMTVLNGMGVTGEFSREPVWVPDRGSMAEHLEVRFAYSQRLWPWSGFLALYISVLPSGQNERGEARGHVEFTISSPPAPGESAPQQSRVSFPLKAHIVPTPRREQRILWDQFHSIRYPPGYLPRDNLDVRNDILDWHGDHPHTNYKDMFNFLVDAGYYLEVLGRPFTCFDAGQYGTLLLADTEEEFYPEEVEKLKRDVQELGLGLVVFAEWYNRDMLMRMQFFDDNTRSWWTPYTGGGNVPALNDLLAPFGVAFGDAVLTGHFAAGQASTKFMSGANIARFPAGSYLHMSSMSERSRSNGQARVGPGTTRTAQFPVLGITASSRGRIAVFGDASCLDSSHMVSNCFVLLRQLLEYTSMGKESTQLFTAASRTHEPFGVQSAGLPQRRTDIDFRDVSTVLNYPASCGEEMDAAAWDRRAAFQRTTQETMLLKRRGIGDFGSQLPVQPPPKPPAVSPVPSSHHRRSRSEIRGPHHHPRETPVTAERPRTHSSPAGTPPERVGVVDRPVIEPESNAARDSVHLWPPSPSEKADMSSTQKAGLGQQDHGPLIMGKVLVVSPIFAIPFSVSAWIFMYAWT
uniref:Membrane-bound transcription factor site-1 protease n=1 Tax=Tetraselmis sp. GSL018 TaxID=582737 RepID=A0A061RBV8_9CHLO